MSKRIKVVFIGNGTLRYNLETGERRTFKKNVPEEIGEEDSKKLLELREKGCRCHNAEGRLLFLSYADWKEYYK